MAHGALCLSTMTTVMNPTPTERMVYARHLYSSAAGKPLPLLSAEAARIRGQFLLLLGRSWFSIVHALEKPDAN